MYQLQFLVGTYFVLAVVAELVTQHNITCKPYVVWFSDRKGIPTRLNVDLKAVNIPTGEGSDYYVIAYYKKGGEYFQKSILKLSSEYKPNQVDTIGQNVNKDWDECYIAYCFYNEKQGKCELSKDELYDVIELRYSRKISYDSDCVAGRCELTLDLKNYCKSPDTADSEDRPPVNTGVDPTPGIDLRLVCGLVMGIALLLVVAAVLARWLRRRKREEGGPEENQYAQTDTDTQTAAELTYAVLDLPTAGAGAPAAKEHENMSSYVQIVGIYNPRK